MTRRDSDRMTDTDRSFADETVMRAVELPQWGDADLLTVVEHPVPQPGPGQAVVRIEAAGINPVDWKVRTGAYSAAFGEPFPLILGRDFAGTIVTIGEQTTRFRVGQRIAGSLRFAPRLGCYASHLVIGDAAVATLPADMDAAVAAALPVAGLTAWQALLEEAQVTAGQRVLVHAAAGGVGHLTVQLAKLLGAEVIGTASARNAEFVQGLGADEVIDYSTRPFEDQVSDVDAVIDCVGGEVLEHSYRVLKPGGIAVTMAARPDPAPAEALGVRTSMVFVRPDSLQLQGLVTLVQQGQLTVHVSQRYALAEAAAAHAEQQEGHVRGKLVLMP